MYIEYTIWPFLGGIVMVPIGLGRIVAAIRSRGREQLRSGIALFVIGTLIMLPGCVDIYNLFDGAKQKAQGEECDTNLRVLSTAMLEYSQDSDGKWPPATKWADDIETYLPKTSIDDRPPDSVWHCPRAVSSFSYAFNRALVGRVSESDPQSKIVMLFESDATSRNAFGGPNLLPAEPRHVRTIDIYALADGHIAARERPDDLDWLNGHK